MTNSYWADANAIKTIPRVLKSAIKKQIKNENEMEELQARLNNIKWTEENLEERLRLYNELGQILDKYRINRIRIKWYQERFLKGNITG